MFSHLISSHLGLLYLILCLSSFIPSGPILSYPMPSQPYLSLSYPIPSYLNLSYAVLILSEPILCYPILCETISIVLVRSGMKDISGIREEWRRRGEGDLTITWRRACLRKDVLFFVFILLTNAHVVKCCLWSNAHAQCLQS